MKIYYVTGNMGKLKLAQDFLKGIDVDMLTYDFEEPDVNDIEYIAKWKVKKAYDKIKKPCMALDSGFYIPSYPKEENFPGAFVKRKIIDGIGIDGLLKEMRKVEDRYCYFLECLAYYDGTECKLFWGKSEGILVHERTNINHDKKWSSLWEVFMPMGTHKTLSEMTEKEIETIPNTTYAFSEFKNWYQKREDKKKIKTNS